MTPGDVRGRVLACLAGVAPDADLARLDPAADLRRELDLDSMDLLNLVIALHEEFAVAIPESDYRRISTLAGCVAYLSERMPAG